MRKKDSGWMRQAVWTGTLLWILGQGWQTQATDLFNLPQFLSPGNFAIGLQTMVTLTGGAGVAVSGKYTHGVSDLSNLQVTLGSGGGPRRFRAGVGYTFDFFPDIEGQPGIGLAAQAFHYRLVDTSQTELSATPYVHKGFVSGDTAFRPFFGVPIGIGFNSDGTYKTLLNLSVGSVFKTFKSISWVVELGVPVVHAETYVTAGVVYSHE